MPRPIKHILIALGIALAFYLLFIHQGQSDDYTDAECYQTNYGYECY